MKTELDRNIHRKRCTTRVLYIRWGAIFADEMSREICDLNAANEFYKKKKRSHQSKCFDASKRASATVNMCDEGF